MRLRSLRIISMEWDQCIIYGPHIPIESLRKLEGYDENVEFSHSTAYRENFKYFKAYYN